MDEIEYGRLAADFFASNVEKIGEVGKSMGRKAQAKFGHGFKNYLSESLKHYTKTKSFFIQDGPVGLYDFYEPIAVSSRDGILDDPNYTKIIELGRCAIITGTGGSGKSILMKHLFVSCIESKDRIPVFVELRELNEDSQRLPQLIHEKIRDYDDEFDEDFLNAVMKAGHFAFILDGYDEIDRANQRQCMADIRRLVKNAPDCRFILSSRPDNELESLDQFNIFEIESLSLESACSLVQKLPVEDSLQANFVRDLRAELFNSHRSFLSNPLMLSIMLLTYGQSAQIPNKFSLFYNQAYEVLFQRHDAFKGGFRRDRRTTLDMQDFSRILQVFCLLSYNDRKLMFSQTEALDYIEKSIEIAGFDVSAGDYLEDLSKAVCLLVEEGISFVFAHRSFQEYFVALYLANAEPNVQDSVLARCMENMGSDSVIRLLYEMNKGLVERKVFIPRLEAHFKLIGVKRAVGITHYVAHLKRFFTHVSVNEEHIGYRLVSSKRSDEARVALEVFYLFFVKELSDQGKAVANKGISDKELKEKYLPAGQSEKDYKLSDYSYRSEFIRDLAASTGSFSMGVLIEVKKQLKLLQYSRKKEEKSLVDLLKG